MNKTGEAGFLSATITDLNQLNTCMLLCGKKSLQFKNNDQITVSFSGGWQHLQTQEEVKVQEQQQ